MKKIVAFILAAVLFTAPAAFAGKGFPMTLAGITLGQDIEKFTKNCDMKLASFLPDAPYLIEARLKPDAIPGVRGGSLDYAGCLEKGKLIRIKLKFNDTSQKFFNTLLKQYIAKFGDADSYQGDAFKNVIAWQWNFTQGTESVSLTLMWSRDKEIRPGVSIKMTLESLLDKEYDCFKQKSDRIDASKGGLSTIRDLNEFVPR